MKTMTSKEFNQKANEAQRIARLEPLLVTNRGKPDLVVLNYMEYERLAGKPKTLYDVLMEIDPEISAKVAEIEFEIPPRSTAHRRPVEFD